ncbi:MAG: succinylglutamate desuccinylase/aspartoacylase family protein [Kiritimatiellae bacterium]|nr:succinylglutamate desuccinylase/aspartoacylase family protein [Kiritimatiellia bacterium]
MSCTRSGAPGTVYDCMEFEGQKIPVAIADGGTGNGKTLAVIGMQHATEFSGPGSIDRVLDLIDPISLKGRLICLPFVNPIHRDLNSEEHNQQCKNPETNLNRQWPGDPDSDNVFSRLSAFIWERVISRSDAILDMHCCRTLDPRFVSCQEGHATGEALAVALGLEAVDLQTEESYAKGILHVTASSQLDIPAVLVESHPSGFQVREAVDACACAIFRGMRHMGILESIPESIVRGIMNPVALFRRSEAEERIHATRPGCLCMRCWPGEKVEKGDVIAVIRSLDTFEIIEDVVSPLTGAVSCATQPLINEGDIVGHVKAAEWQEVL